MQGSVLLAGFIYWMISLSGMASQSFTIVSLLFFLCVGLTVGKFHLRFDPTVSAVTVHCHF